MSVISQTASHQEPSLISSWHSATDEGLFWERKRKVKEDDMDLQSQLYHAKILMSTLSRGNFDLPFLCGKKLMPFALDHRWGAKTSRAHLPGHFKKRQCKTTFKTTCKTFWTHYKDMADELEEKASNPDPSPIQRMCRVIVNKQNPIRTVMYYAKQLKLHE